MSTQSSVPTASPLDYHAAPVAPGRARSSRAIAALVLGILALPASMTPLAGWVLGVTAIVVGASARSDARRSGRAGVGQATAGVVLGVLAVLLSTALVLGVLWLG